jgi:hypothetical protein
LFLPVLLWDLFKKGFRDDGHVVFLKLWLCVMFAFFSISVGKRPVYLLPIYPALSLLLARWFYDAKNAPRGRLAIYRSIAIVAVITSVLLAVITLGAFWSHDHAWFFAPIESLLKPKDRANVLAVRNQLEHFGWRFTTIASLATFLWASLARSLWFGRMRAVAHQLIILSIIYGYVGSSVFTPVIAQGKSYRAFMTEVNERVGPMDQLYIYGRFNSDSLVFYRGRAIERLNEPTETLAAKAGKTGAYVIMPERNWKDLQAAAGVPLATLVRSEGKGPEGDVPLVLLRAEVL